MKAQNQNAIETTSHTAKYHYEQGESLAKIGQFREAEIHYQKAIELNSKWFKPYYSLGVVLDKQGKIEESCTFYERSLEINPNFAWSYFHLGNLYRQKRLLEKASESFKKAIEVHPPEKSYWFHLALGDLLIEQGEYNLAIQSYTQGTKIDPKKTQGQFKLALALTKQQDWQGAIALFRQVIHTQPNFHQAYVELGDALCQIDKEELAIPIYQKAMELKPNDAKSYQRLQQCLVRRSGVEYPELQNCYSILQQETNKVDVYFEVAKVFVKRGLIEEAVKVYLKILAIQPTFTSVYENLKHATLYLKNLDGLVTAYRKVIQEHPNLLPACIGMGNVLTEQGRTQEASDFYQKAVYQKCLAKAPEFVHKYWDDKQQRRPHFIIIGAEKCGTTSLHNYIIQHPWVLEPVEKEIHFFTQKFDKGFAWYEAHFPPISQESDYITGEASTSYIGCHNNAPERLFNLYPNVKLIAVLRYPVDRAISHYNQLVKLGREGRSLEEVVTAEIEVLEGVEDIWSVRQQYWSVGKGCIWHGLYVYFLKRWMSVFPKEQLLILKSEDLFEQPGEIMKQVFEFLELPDYQLSSYPQYNSGGTYKRPEKLIIYKKMAAFFHIFNQKLENVLRVKVCSNQD
ncbi:tetratricopeptide repeat protein [Okeania sp.]|uniref:tetratricopeptide repeat-containing sulfotransferase family protein n=1 Tax=Okeania sp. TaxID=3100323 RepID=UPI002B4B4F58|nr:tetratricopeptide repeat protein [Okeania sp.]MEB3341291.1 tetratricopeptide repeat protein [Okeania sp.]